MKIQDKDRFVTSIGTILYNTAIVVMSLSFLIWAARLDFEALPFSWRVPVTVFVGAAIFAGIGYLMTDFYEPNEPVLRPQEDDFEGSVLYLYTVPLVGLLGLLAIYASVICIVWLGWRGIWVTLVGVVMLFVSFALMELTDPEETPKRLRRLFSFICDMVMWSSVLLIGFGLIFWLLGGMSEGLWLTAASAAAAIYAFLANPRRLRMNGDLVGLLISSLLMMVVGATALMLVRSAVGAGAVLASAWLTLATLGFGWLRYRDSISETGDSGNEQPREVPAS